ncbi:NAD(P)H-binding protein [Protofrankia symbiont of Coriaria ruscifolia]|uniref:NAD(P)H-binding protein n=1 Tax=Protofrankia symbiont of Coriaria ruscifolia TaxID=1306542 RepID=UPI0013EFB6D5|nr:NAD(P)H-binding protein [Protofrankia symbiont of Coriaria ruscifolia]
MILVTGATGTVGRQAVAALLARGERVRALTRDPLAAGLPSEVEVVAGDLTVAESLQAVVDEVRAVLLIAAGPSMGEQAARLVTAAGKAAVRQVVALSSLAAGERTRTALGDWHRQVEDAVRAGEPAWTALRANGFMSNAEQWVPEVLAGVVHTAFPQLAASVVDPADLAAVAAEILIPRGGVAAAQRHHGQIYDITGPRALTPTDQVEILAEVLGRSIVVAEQSVAQYRAGLSLVFPPSVVDALLESRSSADDDRATVSPAVERIIGRPPADFVQWAVEHRQLFAGLPSGSVTAGRLA